MNTATIHRLVTLNHHFYRRFAKAFDASRSRPWAGWQQVTSHLGATNRPLEVLDVGCGNGRFALFLEAGGHRFHYLGLDENTDLLSCAVDRLAHLADTKFLELELLSCDLNTVLQGAKFHLIALFGVLHHIPSTAQRQQLLKGLADHLAPGGLLAASVWRANLHPRFHRKVLPWEVYNRRCREKGIPGVDLTHLEPGDTLLTWSGDQGVPRYCHFPTDDELTGWIEAVGLPSIDRFEGDGKSAAENLYLVLQRPA